LAVNVVASVPRVVGEGPDFQVAVCDECEKGEEVSPRVSESRRSSDGAIAFRLWTAMLYVIEIAGGQNFGEGQGIPNDCYLIGTRRRCSRRQCRRLPRHCRMGIQDRSGCFLAISSPGRHSERLASLGSDGTESASPCRVTFRCVERCAAVSHSRDTSSRCSRVHLH